MISILTTDSQLCCQPEEPTSFGHPQFKINSTSRNELGIIQIVLQTPFDRMNNYSAESVELADIYPIINRWRERIILLLQRKSWMVEVQQVGRTFPYTQDERSADCAVLIREIKSKKTAPLKNIILYSQGSNPQRGKSIPNMCLPTLDYAFSVLNND